MVAVVDAAKLSLVLLLILMLSPFPLVVIKIDVVIAVVVVVDLDAVLRSLRVPQSGPLMVARCVFLILVLGSRLGCGTPILRQEQPWRCESIHYHTVLREAIFLPGVNAANIVLLPTV